MTRSKLDMILLRTVHQICFKVVMSYDEYVGLQTDKVFVNK